MNLCVGGNCAKWKEIEQLQQTINEQKEEIEGLKKNRLDHNPQHESVDAFWKKWEEVGEPHKHGVYESTWMAFNSAVEALEVKALNKGDSDE